MVEDDILDQLRIDPGRRTLGQLLQDRTNAAHEIQLLRLQVSRLGASVPRRALRHDGTSSAKSSGELVEIRAGTLVRLSEVCRLLGISRSTIYKRLSDGTFPQPVRLGPRTVRWRIEAIDSWRDSLPVKGA